MIRYDGVKYEGNFLKGFLHGDVIVTKVDGSIKKFKYNKGIF